MAQTAVLVVESLHIEAAFLNRIVADSLTTVRSLNVMAFLAATFMDCMSPQLSPGNQAKTFRSN